MANLKCDGVGCVFRRGGVVAISRRPEALADDCARAQVLISAVAARCKGPAVLIDRDAAAAGQGWQIILTPTPSAQSVRQWRGDRPWVAKINSGE
jgi:competence protein ComEC